jgi:hypothetical protein
MNTEAKPTKRLGNPNWKKGVSGNPGGRPKGWPALRAAAQKASPLALRTLIAMCRKGESGAVRVAAAVAIMDRAYGKPEQRHSADNVGVGLTVGDIRVTFVAVGDSLTSTQDHLELDGVCEEPMPTLHSMPTMKTVQQITDSLPVRTRRPRGSGPV